MPLHMELKINNDLIQTLHIARISEGESNPKILHRYAVITVDHPAHWTEKLEPNEADYLNAPIKFIHRYGDGASVCFLKALQAVEEYNAKEAKKLLKTR